MTFHHWIHTFTLGIFPFKVSLSFWHIKCILKHLDMKKPVIHNNWCLLIGTIFFFFQNKPHFPEILLLDILLVKFYRKMVYKMILTNFHRASKWILVYLKMILKLEIVLMLVHYINYCYHVYCLHVTKTWTKIIINDIYGYHQ